MTIQATFFPKILTCQSCKPGSLRPLSPKNVPAETPVHAGHVTS